MKNFKFQISNFKLNTGYTLIELLLSLGIIAIISGFSIFNLLSANDKTSINTTAVTLVSDLKQQQIKAMIGATEGRSAHDSYGIHFNSNSYVLFHGPVFNSNDTSNYTITLSNSLIFTGLTIPNNEVIFASVIVGLPLT